VARAEGLEELMDTGMLLDAQPAPAGSRTVLVGNAGGPLVLAADAADRAGLELPELSMPLQERIRAIVPGAAAAANPVDLSAEATPEQIVAVVDAIASSGETDACVAVVVEIDDRSATVATALERVASNATLALAYLGGDVAESRVPTFPSPERVVRALALAARRAAWLRLAAADDDATGARPSIDATSFTVARRTVRAALEGAAPARQSTWLNPGAALDLMASVGVPVAPFRTVTSAGQCAAAFRQIGGSCVIKAVVDGVVHKSDEGAVVVGIDSAEQSRITYRAMARRFGERFRGALVQARVRPAVELLIGAVRDPQFGPLVVVAAGGVDAEILDDRAVMIAPVNLGAATRAIEGLRMAPLLHGYRNRPPKPVPKIAELVARIGRLVATVPEIDQIDLNPVIVDSAGCVAVDAMVAVAAVAHPAVPLRGLRSGQVTTP
jgi:acyl-CoA synthetase (NDP forming)